VTSADVRQKLNEALVLDLIGPEVGSVHESETLSQAPSRWYLTGFLVPTDSTPASASDDNQDEEIDKAAEGGGGGDDSGIPESSAARRAVFPSSMGMSLLVPKAAKTLTVTVCWGDYEPVYETPADPKTDTLALPVAWKRTQKTAVVPVTLRDSLRPTEAKITNSGGLMLAVAIRPVKDIPAFELVAQKETRSVSVFLVNRRKPQPDDVRDTAFVFQAQLRVQCDEPLVARPNLRGFDSNDWDERVADLQYHDAYECAVGHGVSTFTPINTNGKCHQAFTCWIPTAQVERVAPADIPNVAIGMEELAELADVAEARKKLSPLVTQYRDWLTNQSAKVPNQTNRAETAKILKDRATVAGNRIQAGIDLLADPQALLAFKLANKVMAAQSRRRFGTMQGKDPASIKAPAWRPFQLAFVLMNLKGIADPADDDRSVVDLLFFPTGGGKTEAYLGLAAFTLVLRRLKTPGIQSAGVCVLMRYTLRLLTLDQLGRAATLICALELERQQHVDLLGDWPFEIGLWVGRAATPNEMGRKGDGNQNSARHRTIAYRNNSSKSPPIPLEDCPWCGTKFIPESFRLMPNQDNPTDLRITCCNAKDDPRKGTVSCDFSGKNALPVLAVDEPIYRRLPCFLIATVDKFAAIPWTGRVGGFFGRVDRFDRGGFYGPCDPVAGAPMPGQLLPPELIIQDELHLISGPMGTMVGLYESALDELCTRTVDGKNIRPKIVASTATVRRAENQIKALFNRSAIDIFPPPGPDRRDSFFARVHTPQESNPRLYVGIAAQGRSLKVILLRTYLALMGAAQKWYKANGGNKTLNNPADPYMTLVGYFNSLRELGGSRRIIEDEVSTRLEGYGKRFRGGETEGLFERREIKYDVVELTSRVATDKVAEAKRLLAIPFAEKDHVDVAIATNMISVGLDITRLGLMVVLGQPKTSAEYIQATSRVGRDVDRPGLVVTVMNIHRPRDRSHYERFACYHETFYRSVEATSVTPFSPRALDRGLAGTLVALVRQTLPTMTPALGAREILRNRAAMDSLVDSLVSRAEQMVVETKKDSEALRDRVRSRVVDLLDEWSRIAHDYNTDGIALQYQSEVGGAQPLLHTFLDPELKKKPRRHQKFRANRSMRDVEPSVNLWVKTFDNFEVEEDSQ
jgi:Helicase conserved C-terminal domain